MPSNDKLYEIFEKYNLNSQPVKFVEPKKHSNINEVYQNYKISKYNFVHKNSYKANISEVVFGNVFKGTVYLNQDDILFLRQFDPYYWKQALFMRYDKYLFEYLKRLNNLRQNEYSEVYKHALEHEKSVLDTDPLYISAGNSALSLAKLHAKDIAKQFVDKRYNYTTVPPEMDSSLQPFDLVTRGFDGYRFFAKPYIKPLVKRLEGTVGVHDGFDLHNPREVQIKTTTKDGKVISATKKATDGFVFPSEESIRDMIEDYLRLLGNQIVKYDAEDLKHKPNHPEKDSADMPEQDAKYHSYNGGGGRKLVDSMYYELTKDFLMNNELQKLIASYRASGVEINTSELRKQADQNAKNILDRLISEGKFKTGKREIRIPDPANPGSEIILRPEDLPTGDRGLITKTRTSVKGGKDKGKEIDKIDHPNLYLLHHTNFVKKAPIKFNKDGDVVYEGQPEIVETEMPVLKSGHAYKKLTREELDVLDKLKQVGNDPNRLDPFERDIYNRVFAGDPSRVLRGEHMDVENADHPDESKKFRSLYIHSEHLPGANKQGSEHSRAGGLFPNAETPERQYLRKYDIKISEDAIEKFHNPKYARKIERMFSADGLGHSLRSIIKDYIENRLNSSELQETFNLRVERSVLLMFLPQLVEIGLQKVFENLDRDNIETDVTVIKDLVSKMLTSMEQQDFGRGSRRRRQNAVAASPQEAADLFSFTKSISCGPGIRRMETGTCRFVYRLENLEELASNLSDDIRDLQKTVSDDGASVSEKETSIGEIISSFQFAMHDLGLAYLAKAFYDNPDENWASVSVKNNYAKQAQEKADKFVEEVLESFSSNQTEEGSAIKAGMAIERIKAEIEETFKGTPMPADVNPLVIQADRELNTNPIDHVAIVEKYKAKQVPAPILDYIVSHARQINSTINKAENILEKIINGSMIPTLIFTLNTKYITRPKIDDLVKYLQTNLNNNTNFANNYRDKILGYITKSKAELNSRSAKGIKA